MARLKEEEGGKLKPAGYTHEYTKEQVAELIRCANDPKYFILNYVMIQHPTRGSVKFAMYDYQERLVDVYNTSDRVIAMLPRQAGKTTTAAAYLLWWAIFKDDQTVLITGKDHDGAKEVMGRLWYAYEELPWWLKPGVITDQVHTKKFDNNSIIRAVATTPTAGRGKSNSIVYCDEFAYVRPNIAEAFWTALAPTLATGGNLIITSTPNTDEDKFSSIWFNANIAEESDEWVSPHNTKDDGDEEYETIYEDEAIEERLKEYNELMSGGDDDDEDVEVGFTGMFVKWDQIPDPKDPTGFRGRNFKRRQFKEGFTLEQWEREYECKFISGDATLISPMKLASLNNHARKPRFIDRWGARWYDEIKPNYAYAVVLDPSQGVNADDACIQVWEIPTMTQIAEWNDNQADQPEQARMLKRMLKRLYLTQQDDPEHRGDVNIYYSVERNSLGIGIINIIEENEESFPGWMLDSTATTMNVRGSKGGMDSQNYYRGLLTSVSTKKRFCLELKSLVERNLFVPRSRDLITQFKNFIKKGNSYEAKEGTKDDIVMSCVLMCHLIEELRFHEPDLEDTLAINLNEDYDPEDDAHPDNMAFAPVV